MGFFARVRQMPIIAERQRGRKRKRERGEKSARKRGRRKRDDRYKSIHSSGAKNLAF